MSITAASRRGLLVLTMKSIETCWDVYAGFNFPAKFFLVSLKVKKIIIMIIIYKLFFLSSCYSNNNILKLEKTIPNVPVFMTAIVRCLGEQESMRGLVWTVSGNIDGIKAVVSNSQKSVFHGPISTFESLLCKSSSVIGLTEFQWVWKNFHLGVLTQEVRGVFKEH